MMYRLILPIIIFICSCPFFSANAQFTGIDASQFPTIKAYGGGTIFNNAKSTDFSIVENGQAMQNGLSVQCSTAVNDPSVNVVMVLDISESMNEKMSNGRTKLEWVKNGAKNFVNSLIFNGTTQCAIVTFNGNSYIHLGFQNNAQSVLNAIDAISYGIGATIYDNPLIDPKNSVVALFKTTPSWIRRVVVFLTDGTPTQAPQTNSIINQLKALNVTLYAIALSFDASPDLRTIASQTGGTTSVAYNEEMLVNIYKELGNTRPTITYCWLTYIAPYGCDDKSLNRTVQLTYKPTNLRQTFSYTAPANSIARIQNSAITLPPFPDIATGQTATQQYTITALNSDINVTGFFSSLPANFSIINWGGSAPPFLLKKDQSRVVTAQFTQTSPRDVRTGFVRINGTPCSSAPLYLSGGSRKVVLISPNGSEVFSSCDSILITWGGVEASDTVRIHYSSNGGASWHLISNSATRLSYKWKAPKQDNYMIRVSAFTSRYGSIYNATAGGIGLDTIGGIGVSADASSFAFTGTYDKQLTANSLSISSTRNKDMFIAKCKDQTVNWLKTSSVFYPKYLPYTSCAGKAVIVDSADNMYHISDIVRTVNSGRQSLILSKISSNGNIDWSKEILGTQQSLIAHNIGKDSIGNYYLTGTYNGQLSVQLKAGNTSSIITILPKLFTLSFDANGNFLMLKDSISKAYPKIPADTAKDTLGYVYTIKSYRNTLTLSDTSFKSIGSQDIAIRVSGRIMTPFDESDAPFSITTPLLTLTSSTISFTGIEGVLVGDKKDSVFNGFLCNRSRAQVVLDQAIIQGIDSTQFEVLQPNAGTLIQPDSCIPCIIRFSPTTSGKKQATIVLGNSCINVQASIYAEAYAMSASIIPIQWNQRRVKTNKTLFSLFKNEGEIPLTIISLSNKDLSHFVLDNTILLPMTILPGDSAVLSVTFTPTDTIQYHDTLMVECKELQSPLLASLDGIGILPVFSSKGYTFADSKTGIKSSEIGLISTINTSQNMNMYVKRALLSQNAGDFTLDSLSVLPNSFSILDSHKTFIGFKPIKSGLRTAYLVFEHDAIAGPEENPLTYDSVLIQGIGISSELLPDTVLDFGTINSCDKAMKSLAIKNPNAQDIAIIGMNWEFSLSTNASHINALVNLPFIIPANGETRFPVQFIPDGKQSYEAKLHLLSADSSIYTVLIFGKAETIASSVTITSSNQLFSVKPGESQKISISATLAKDLTQPLLQACTLSLLYDPSLYSLRNSIVSLNNNWQWTSTSIDNVKGIALIEGKATVPSIAFPRNPVAECTFDSYLNIDKNQPIQITLITNTPCIDTGYGSINTELQPVCYNPGRIIGSNGIPLAISIVDMPFSSKIVHISLPFEAISDAIVVDIKGRIFPLMNKEFKKSGLYEYMLPNIPEGFYTVIVHNGIYQQSQSFIHE